MCVPGIHDESGRREEMLSCRSDGRATHMMRNWKLVGCFSYGFVLVSQNSAFLKIHLVSTHIFCRHHQRRLASPLLINSIFGWRRSRQISIWRASEHAKKWHTSHDQNRIIHLFAQVIPNISLAFSGVGIIYNMAQLKFCPSLRSRTMVTIGAADRVAFQEEEAPCDGSCILSLIGHKTPRANICTTA